MSAGMADPHDTSRPLAPLRILIVEEDRLAARSLETAVAAGEGRLELVGTATTDATAVTLAGLEEPDVVVVGRSPGGDLPRLAALLRAVSSAPVLAAAGAEDAVEAHRAGAAGVVSVTGPPAEVAQSLYEVATLVTAFGSAAR